MQTKLFNVIWKAVGLTLILGVLLSTVAFAQDPTPTPGAPAQASTAPQSGLPTPTPIPGADNLVDFRQLGYSEIRMTGPFASAQVVFSVPVDWQLSPGTELQFHYDVFVASDTPDWVPPERLILGTLDFNFNDQTVDSVLLESAGEKTIKVSMPPESLISPRTNGLHTLTINLTSRESCLYGYRINVLIYPDSRFSLPHESVFPPLELTRIPFPIYQPSLFVPNVATVVIPDQPTPAELEAALVTAEGLGNMTGGDMTFNMVGYSDVTEDIMQNSHLVFVGKPASFPMLADVELPAPFSGGSLAAPGAAPDDGILEMGVSPWGSSKVVLVVSGASDTAVTKAAHLLATGTILLTDQPALTLARTMVTAPAPVYVAMDRTFTELGYTDRTAKKVGITYMDFLFYVPPKRVAGLDSYVEVVFNHTALLDYATSGMVVSVNGTLVGSVAFSDATTQQTKAKISIPRSVVRSGNNRITVQIDMTPKDLCSNLNYSSMWTTIFSSSLLHMPLEPVTTAGLRALNLRNVPDLFDVVDGNIAFVVPPDDMSAWKAAASVAFDFGGRLGVNLPKMKVVTSDAVTDELLQNYDLVVIGRPSDLPVLDQLADTMPAAYEPGTDNIKPLEILAPYGLPSERTMGYLQLFPSVANQDRLVLAVLGNKAESVTWAANALTLPILRAKIFGNLALVNGEQIASMDTQERLVAGATPVPTSAAVEPGAEPAAQPTPTVKRPAWIIPAVGIALAGILAVIIIVALNSLSKRKE